MPRFAGLLMTLAVLTACGQGGFAPSDGDRVFAPGVAGSSDIDGLLIGHRLMSAGEYELALRAYTSAAAQQGLNVDTLSALGSANLKLGRLNQAEQLLRRAVWNAAKSPKPRRCSVAHLPRITEIPTKFGTICAWHSLNWTIRLILPLKRTNRSNWCGGARVISCFCRHCKRQSSKRTQSTCATLFYFPQP